jgi:hypothetical protein
MRYNAQNSQRYAYPEAIDWIGSIFKEGLGCK